VPTLVHLAGVVGAPVWLRVRRSLDLRRRFNAGILFDASLLQAHQQPYSEDVLAILASQLEIRALADSLLAIEQHSVPAGTALAGNVPEAVLEVDLRPAG
jgi:hypothetical protein